VAGAVLVAAVLATGCAQSGDLSGDVSVGTDRAASPASSASSGPAWFLAGMASARRDIAAREGLVRPDLPAASAAPVAAAGNGLPPKAQFVAALTGLGIGETSAACMYDSVSTGAAAGDAAAIFKLLVAQSGQAGVAAVADAATALQSLDQTSVTRFVVAVLPCIDTGTLTTLLSAAGVASAGSGTAGLASVLAGLSGTNLSGVNLSGISQSALSQLASTAGASLSPTQLSALATLLSNASSGTIGSVDLSKVDLSKLDLANLSATQSQLLLAVILRGLTTEQQDQLNTLGSVNLAKLGLKIDPAKVPRSQYGALALLLLPYLASAINIAPGATPPAGADPGQIYVPPGLDLSQINPLLFASKDNVVNALQKQGLTPQFGGCLYDRLSTLDPRFLGVALEGKNPTASGQLLLTIVSCVVGP